MGDTGRPGNATDLRQRGDEAEICSAISCWFGVQRAWSGSSGDCSSSGPSVCVKGRKKHENSILKNFGIQNKLDRHKSCAL